MLCQFTRPELWTHAAAAGSQTDKMFFFSNLFTAGLEDVFRFLSALLDANAANIYFSIDLKFIELA